MDDLPDGYGGVFKGTGLDGQGTFLGSSMSTDLPAGWYEHQESLWETLTFQRNINLPRVRDRLGLSMAILCADVKARDVSKSEMLLWRKNGRQWDEVQPGRHWFARMLARRPNEWMSWTEFWRMTVFHLALAQNAYVLKEINRQGDLISLVPLPPAQVRARVTDTGRLVYEVGARTEFDRARLGEDYIIVPASRMIHLRGRMANAIHGLSNHDLGGALFDLLDKISGFQNNMFGSDGRQPLVFESDAAVWGTGEQADAAFRRLKEQLRTAWRKGEPILLEAGYKAKIVAQNARDAMTSEAFNATMMRICALMEVPPHKVFAYETIKYENMAAADQLYANDHLIPLVKNIEEKFRLELLDEREWDLLWPEFERMLLVAGDPKTMSDMLDKAVKNGALLIDEYRERLPLNLNPLPNDAGQVRLVPVNMAVVDLDGNVVQQAATGQPNNDGVTEVAPEPSKGLRVVGGIE